MIRISFARTILILLLFAFCSARSEEQFSEESDSSAQSVSTTTKLEERDEALPEESPSKETLQEEEVAEEGNAESERNLEEKQEVDDQDSRCEGKCDAWTVSWPGKGGFWALEGWRDTFQIGFRFAGHEWVEGDTRDPEDTSSRSAYFIGTVSEIDTGSSHGFYLRTRLLGFDHEPSRGTLSLGIQLSYDQWELTWYKTPLGCRIKEGDAEFDDLGYGLYVEGKIRPLRKAPMDLAARGYLIWNSIGCDTTMDPSYARDGSQWRSITIDSTGGTSLGYEIGLIVGKYVEFLFGQRFTDADVTAARFRKTVEATGQLVYAFDNEKLNIDSHFTYFAFSFRGF